MEASLPATAIASALSVSPSSRLNRFSRTACFRRRRRRPPRYCWKLRAAVEEREAKDEDAAKGRRLQRWFSLDKIGIDILSIAVPAALALAADPIAALVDTAFVGHLGSAELAAVGVSISVFNLVSKLFNVPLLNVTTSFVAEQQATDDDYTGNQERPEVPSSSQKMTQKRKFLPAVSTSLALAAGIGLVETVALIFGSGTLMNMIGVPVDSPMRIPAEQFLTFRAYGAPPIVVALAAQGAFRGLMDTKTPLYAVGKIMETLLAEMSKQDYLFFHIFIFLMRNYYTVLVSAVSVIYIFSSVITWKSNNQQ